MTTSVRARRIRKVAGRAPWSRAVAMAKKVSESAKAPNRTWPKVNKTAATNIEAMADLRVQVAAKLAIFSG